MDPIVDDILMHYGVKRRSGRYPWGSGENPYQHGGDFLTRVEELEALGKSQKEIAEELKMSTTDLRMQVRVAKHERRALQAERAKSLREEGKTLDEIAKIMGYNNDSSVRALLNENTASNKNKALATAEALKKELAVKGALDVGEGVEQQLGVSKGVLQEALFILETEGYNRYGVGVPQVNDPKKRTITPVISVPDIEQRDAYQNLDIIKSVGDYHSADGGASWDIQNYNSDIYPQEPEELPAQWGFYWSDDPKKPLPFVAMSTSPYMTGNCCTHNGHVWQSGQDNNVWEPGTVNVKWTDLGSIEEVMDN